MKVILCIIVSLLIGLKGLSQSNLLQCAEGENEITTTQKELNLSFTPVIEDGRILVNGDLQFPGKKPEDIFGGLLYKIVSMYPSSRKVVQKIDVTHRRCLVKTSILSTKYASTGTSYQHMTAYEVEGEHLRFTIYDITCNHLGSFLSLSYVSEPFEELMPDLNPKKKKYKTYLKEFLEGNNEVQSVICNGITEFPAHAITHWSNIERGTVIDGMNTIECTISWGKPKEVNKTQTAGTISEQWVYSASEYLYFDNSKLVGIQN